MPPPAPHPWACWGGQGCPNTTPPRLVFSPSPLQIPSWARRVHRGRQTEPFLPEKKRQGWSHRAPPQSHSPRWLHGFSSSSRSTPMLPPCALGLPGTGGLPRGRAGCPRASWGRAGLPQGPRAPEPSLLPAMPPRCSARDAAPGASGAQRAAA